MTAPKRIWAWETLNCNGQWTIAEGDGIEYIRADLANAQWNAAIRAAAKKAHRVYGPSVVDLRDILALLKNEKQGDIS